VQQSPDQSRVKKRPAEGLIVDLLTDATQHSAAHGATDVLSVVTERT
jgi:hypothetical protein